MREFLKGLELDEKAIDSIMAEYGKNITKYKDEIDGYKTTIDSYKTEVDNYKDTINQLNNTIATNTKDLEDYTKIKEENKDLNAQLQMSGKNVKQEFSKFVKNEVLSMVDDNTDFETALNSYKEEHPQYFGETQVIKTSSSPSLANDNQPQTTSNIMNDIIRNAR